MIDFDKTVNKFKNQFQHVDLKALMENNSINNDQEDVQFILKIIEVFLGQSPLLVRQAISYYESENYKDLRSVIHKYKSNCGIVSAQELFSLCANLELLLDHRNNYDPSLVSDYVIRINKETDEVLKEIRKIFDVIKTEIQ